MAPVLPGGTIGVVGGGQLGRMLAMEALRMGYRVVVLDPGEDPPAAQVGARQIRAPLDDAAAMKELAAQADVITLEWENADAEALAAAAGAVPVRPGPHVLKVAQHRVREKDTARRLGLDTAEYRAVDTRAELTDAVAALGAPAILKTCRGGYDGKGQVVLHDAQPATLDAAWEALGAGARELILEQRVAFEREVSVVCARGPDGSLEHFPVVENQHSGGILDISIAPARLPEPLLQKAARVATRMTEGLEVVGMLAVEMFVTTDGRVLVNEIAPRPHNSGHLTWEACSVSQFEQQLRAVCGLPLASPELLRPAAMANLLGEHLAGGLDAQAVAGALAGPHAALHLYGKRGVRPGRKMGHLTVLADTPDQAAQRAAAARTAIAGTAAPDPE